MKTADMTAAEIAFAKKVPVRFALQGATLAAQIRTGKRVGVAVSAGRFKVQLTAYARNAKGAPRGACDLIHLATVASESEAIAFLNAYA